MELFYTSSSNMSLTRGTKYSAGLDLPFSSIDSQLGETLYLINTGIKVKIPNWHVGLVFIRSSLGMKGVSLKNGVGVIDSDYRGEIKLLIEVSKVYNEDPLPLKVGDRVAQLVVTPYHIVEPILVHDLNDITSRGSGGFGSTGR